jgi:hypothetical protein
VVPPPLLLLLLLLLLRERETTAMGGGSEKRKKGSGGGFACCATSPRAGELPLRQPASPREAGERDDPGTPPQPYRGKTPEPVRASKTPDPVRRGKTPARTTMPKSSASGAAAGLSEGHPPEHVPPTAEEGWLWKAGEHHTAWKRRWFKLDAETRTLMYFADEKHAQKTHAKEKGHIDLTGISEESIRSVSGAPRDFDIVTGSRTYHLRADEAEGETAASSWQTALKHLLGGSSGRRTPDVDAASQRFREAQAAHQPAEKQSGRAPELEEASQRFRDAQEVHRSVVKKSEQIGATDRTSRSGVCADVSVAPVSPWSARDPKPSHVIGYDSPIAHSLGYLGDKGRVPSHRLRYIA